MALIRNGTTNSARVRELTERLAGEIREAPPHGEPYVYESRIGQTGSYHVTVVWNEWADLPLQARSRIILDAYERADPGKKGRITIAMGLTQAEAGSMGMLPYSVIANLKQTEGHLRPRVVQALLNEGAIETPQGPQLRFRTRAEAEQATERLERAMPDVSWGVVQEMQDDA